jgi:hypothetical protein
MPVYGSLFTECASTREKLAGKLHAPGQPQWLSAIVANIYLRDHRRAAALNAL